ncbi:MAG: hypothetical protein ACRD6B_01335 [Bryobacteraceae bacterium]
MIPTISPTDSPPESSVASKADALALDDEEEESGDDSDVPDDARDEELENDDDIPGDDDKNVDEAMDDDGLEDVRCIAVGELENSDVNELDEADADNALEGKLEEDSLTELDQLLEPEKGDEEGLLEDDGLDDWLVGNGLLELLDKREDDDWPLEVEDEDEEEDVEDEDEELLVGHLY